MNDTLKDMAQGLGAVALCGPVVVLPGFALAGGAGVLGFWRRSLSSQVQLALIAAFALLPGLDSLVVRLAGLTPALALNLALAVGGVPVLIKMGAFRLRSPRRAWPILLGLSLWTLLVGYAYWDWDWGGRLYSSIAATDMVKHAATIQAIVDTGAPPIDPFFARPTPSGYYYFFYTLGALVQRLGSGLVDARAAFAGTTVWAGAAMFALAAELLTRSGYTGAEDIRRLRPTLIALLLVSALDILPICLLGAAGIWPPTLGTWNEEVTPWLQSLLWVPHHITALVAIWAALLTLNAVAAGPDADNPRPRQLCLAVIFAALAFVSALGASIWVTLAGVFTVALWLAVLAWERRWRGLGLVLAAGLLALLLAAPHLHDLAADRQDQRFPIAFTIRAFKMFDLLVNARWIKAVGRTVLLPLNYGLEFGVMALGAILFLARAKAGELWRDGNGVARLLILSAVAGSFETFLKSTIIFNDLGWRVMLFPQTTFLIWTCLALRGEIDRPIRSRGDKAVVTAWSFLLFVGYLTTLYGLFGLRFYAVLKTPCSIRCSAADPAIHRQLRDAYAWLGRHIPPSEVVQQRPGPYRVFDFGLYGRNRVGVADKQAMLFGASGVAVKARIAVLTPIFTTPMPAPEASARARSQGVDLLIAKATDPAWAARGSWVWAAAPIYAAPMVRVVTVRSLARAR